VGEDAAAFYTSYYSGRPNVSAAESESDRGNGRSRYWSVVRNVPALRQTGENVADIGCGDGGLCAELKAHGWKSVMGVDLSSVRIRKARERYPQIQFDDRPLDQSGVPEGSLDLVIMDNVIEHLPEPADMIDTLRRYLKTGGRIVVITPNMESGHYRLLGRRWTPELAPHAHIYLFTPASLQQLLAQAGYEVEHVGNFHLPVYSGRAWLARAASGDIKGAIWRAVQEAGGLYGRLIGKGPMVYVVASPKVAKLPIQHHATAGAGSMSGV
jgi:2-polyprenyl-3-methyl-5-hydroxy-6-metoxy-1,4-benzoquinol methylase